MKTSEMKNATPVQAELTRADDNSAQRDGDAGARKYYAVNLGHGEFGNPANAPVARWFGLADDPKQAQDFALKEIWERLFNKGSVAPKMEVEEIRRYLVSPAWSHIFVGTREELTRWVYDRATRTLVFAQVKDGTDWINMEAWPTADLLESIHDNEVSLQPDEFDVLESDSATDHFVTA